MKIEWGIIEAAAGWQVESVIGKFTIYGPVEKTVEKAREGAVKLCERLKVECVFNEAKVEESK